jgi:hypothetical protein
MHDAHHYCLPLMHYVLARVLAISITRLRATSTCLSPAYRLFSSGYEPFLLIKGDGFHKCNVLIPGRSKVEKLEQLHLASPFIQQHQQLHWLLKLKVGIGMAFTSCLQGVLGMYKIIAHYLQIGSLLTTFQDFLFCNPLHYFATLSLE